MYRVLVNGCNGKMGQLVMNLLDSSSDFVAIGGMDKENTGEYTFPVYTDFYQIQELPDVIIDFSVPQATLGILSFAEQHHIPVVIATTGFSQEQQKKIEESSKQIPIFQSSNMSYSIYIMGKIAQILTTSLEGADIELIETHHNRKIDSPSGTALYLANKVKEASNIPLHYNLNRMTQREKRQKDEIGFSSIRGGNIVGEHTIQFFLPEETFEIKHTCYSRTVFAQGALKAAKFLIGKPNGFYGMEHLS